MLDLMKYHYKVTKTVKDYFNKIQANLQVKSTTCMSKTFSSPAERSPSTSLNETLGFSVMRVICE
jgi:hypothetical protein